MSASTYKSFQSANISNVGLIFIFLGDVAAHEASNLSARMARVDLVEPSPPKLNHKHMQNFLSSISLVRSKQLGLNLEIGESWSDTWQLVDDPMKI